MHGKKKFTEPDRARLAEILGKPAEYLMMRDDEEPSVSKRHCSPYKNLIWEIDRRKLTYTALEKLLNLPYPNISAKMNGVCNFTLTEWTKLSEIFGKPVEYLMARCDGLPAITSKADKNSKISVARRKDTPFKNLLHEMDKRQLSYGSLARLLRISLSSFSMKMRGERNFTAKDIAKLIEFFGKSAEYLFARDDGK